MDVLGAIAGVATRTTKADEAKAAVDGEVTLQGDDEAETFQLDDGLPPKEQAAAADEEKTISVDADAPKMAEYTGRSLAADKDIVLMAPPSANALREKSPAPVEGRPDLTVDPAKFDERLTRLASANVVEDVVAIVPRAAAEGQVPVPPPRRLTDAGRAAVAPENGAALEAQPRLTARSAEAPPATGDAAPALRVVPKGENENQPPVKSFSAPEPIERRQPDAQSVLAGRDPMRAVKTEDPGIRTEAQPIKPAAQSVAAASGIETPKVSGSGRDVLAGRFEALQRTDGGTAQFALTPTPTSATPISATPTASPAPQVIAQVTQRATQMLEKRGEARIETEIQKFSAAATGQGELRTAPPHVAVPFTAVSPVERSTTAEPRLADASFTAYEPAATADAEGPDAPRTTVQPDRPTPAAVRDVAQAVIASRDGDRISLRLDPPELGRVIIDISMADGAVNAGVTAERGETIDLLRRHADALQRELIAAGFQDATLAFGGQHADGRGDSGSPDAHGEGPDAVARDQTKPGSIAAARAAIGRLDLRL